MWRIVEAEWGQKGSLVMLGMFPYMLVVMWGIHQLTEEFLDIGVSYLGLASLFPLMLGVPGLLWNVDKEKRLCLWGGLPLSRTRLGMASILTAVFPWPLAMFNAMVGVWLSDEPAPVLGMIAWGGLVLMIVALTWTADQAFGAKGMYAVGLGAMILAITFDGLTIIVTKLLGGEATFEVEHRPSTAFWSWMQEPGTSVLFYAVAILVLLIGLWRFHRRDLV